MANAGPDTNGSQARNARRNALDFSPVFVLLWFGILYSLLHSAF
jgi:hypothetical protein